RVASASGSLRPSTASNVSPCFIPASSRSKRRGDTSTPSSRNTDAHARPCAAMSSMSVPFRSKIAAAITSRLAARCRRLSQQLTEPPHSLRRVSELLPVVVDAAPDRLDRLRAAVHLGNPHLARTLAGDLLVAEEIVPQAIDQSGRHFRNVLHRAEDEVVLQHGDDLVVRLVA